jgi:hypothetical protein
VFVQMIERKDRDTPILSYAIAYVFSFLFFVFPYICYSLKRDLTSR